MSQQDYSQYYAAMANAGQLGQHYAPTATGHYDMYGQSAQQASVHQQMQGQAGVSGVPSANVMDYSHSASQLGHSQSTLQQSQAQQHLGAASGGLNPMMMQNPAMQSQQGAAGSMGMAMGYGAYGSPMMPGMMGTPGMGMMPSTQLGMMQTGYMNPSGQQSMMMLGTGDMGSYGYGGGMQQMGGSGGGRGRGGGIPPARGGRVPPLHDPNELTTDSIMISGLPATVKNEDLAKYFENAGPIKKNSRTNKPMVWIFMNDQKMPRGDASVTFENAEGAQKAVKSYNGSQFEPGSTITVQFATYGQKPNVQPVLLSIKAEGASRGGHMGGGRSGPRGGIPQMTDRPEDWYCGKCNNLNFHWRTECNRCHTTKIESNPTLAPSGSVKAMAARRGRGGAHGGAGNGGGFGGEEANGSPTVPGPERNSANRGANRSAPYPIKKDF